MLKTKIHNLIRRLLIEGKLRKEVDISHIDGGTKMTKLKEVETVTVRHTTDGKEVSVQATQMPRKVEAGVYLYAKVNQAGMSILQQKHPEVTDTASFEKLIALTFGLPEAGFGSLGNWKTPEQREEWKVLRNGQEWIPPQIGQAIPPTQTANVETPQTAAVADTTNTKADETNVGIILNAIKGGMEETVVMGHLKTRFGKDKAIQLMDIAKNRLNPKVVEEVPKPDPVINFDTSSQPIETSAAPPQNFLF